MPNSILLMSFGASLVLMVADELPNFNVEASCKAVEGFGLSITHTLESCVSDENAANHAKLGDLPAGGAQPLRRRDDGRRPELRRRSDLSADGAGCRCNEHAAVGGEQAQAPAQERFAAPSVKSIGHSAARRSIGRAAISESSA
jgi:hypothetical protein